MFVYVDMSLIFICSFLITNYVVLPNLLIVIHLLLLYISVYYCALLYSTVYYCTLLYTIV